MEQKFLEAFSEVIREQIVKRNRVNIDGLGEFKSSHRKQFQQQFEDGRVVMMPPRDQIEFTPDTKGEI